MKQLIVALYDGIANSVFTSQVLQPLIKKKDTSITIVSFENRPNKSIPKNIELSPNISLLLLKKIPFLGSVSLWYAARQLKNFLKQFNQYELQARGPLAGWICMHALNSKCCEKLTVQARGLVAEEYNYAHAECTGIKKWFHAFRAWQYFTIEKKVFGITSSLTNYRISAFSHLSTNLVRVKATPNKTKQTIGYPFVVSDFVEIVSNHTNKTKPRYPFIIEAVSPALKKYLVKTFQTNSEIITVAESDIPQKLTSEQKQQYRTAIRTQLHIKHSTTVYCYNGSAKPWQCPELVIDFFKKELEKNQYGFLLILSQDKNLFERLCKKAHLKKEQFKILNVEHNTIYSYLAACDIGLLFRKPHIINWVSRPTKVLEYNAAGLAIKHNNTVSWLTKE